MKKYLLFVITISLLCAGTVRVFADASGSCGTNMTWSYTASDNTLTISQSNTTTNSMTNWTSSNYTNATTGRPWQSYVSSIKKIVINGGVKTIGDYAFRGMTAVTSMTFKSTYAVTSIGQYAFYGCTGITSLSIPSTVTTIGNYAFSGCSNITSSFNIGTSSNLTTIGNYAFQDCSKISSITIPKKVTSIGNYAFYGCSKASSLTFTSPSAVTTIGQDAFKNCEKITSVAIPASVTSIGTDAFWYCYALKTVTFEDRETAITLNDYIFEDCTALTSVTFPSTLTTIPAQTFHGCTALETLIIPAAVTNITNSAFTECSALKTIIAYPSTHPTLSGAVTGLTNFTPGNVRVAVFTSAAKIDYKNDSYWSAFDIDTKIEGSCGTSATFALDLTTGVLTISGTGAMDTYSTTVDAPWYLYRDLITSVVVESGITGIGAYAFRYCENVTSVSIPASVTSIGSGAFDNCKGLSSYSYAGTLAQWLNITFGGSSSNPMYYVKKCYVNGSSEITNLVIPNGRTSINAYAFYNCTGLTSVTLPASLTSVGTAAFSTCTNIGAVDFLGTIDQWCSIAFAANTSNPAMYSRQLSINGVEQTEIYLSDELAEIKAYVFYNNEALTSISLKNTTTINSNALNGCNADLIVRGELSGTCGTGLTWSLLDGVLTVSYSSGTGVMNTYSTSSAPWYPYRKSITKVVIGEGVTTVGAYTLYQFTQTCGVFLPSTLTQLNNNAFYSSTGIAYIVSAATTPPTVIDAQNGPSSYTSNTFNSVPTSAIIYVPSGCETAYSTAVTSSHSTSSGWKRFSTFYPYKGTCGDAGNEANVTWVFDPSNSTLTISGTGAMYNSWANASSTPWTTYKTNIQSVVIESGVTSIGRYAFSGCSNLASITIPASVATFNTLSFSGCSNLETVNYLGTANQWASCTFGSTTGHPAYYSHSLYLNGSLMTECTISVPVSNNAFNYNTSLTSVTLANGCTSVGENAFSSCSNLSSLTISPDVTTFGSNAFSSCLKLDKAQEGSVNYLGSANQWASINFSGSSSNPAYYSKSLKLNGTTLTNCTISVDIKAYTFYRNEDLTTLTLGANTKAIGTYAFNSCKSLETVTCSASTPLDSIASSAFYDCKALSNITLPSTLKKVMGSAFYGNNALSSVDFLGTADQWASIYFNGTSSNPASFAQSLKLNGVTLTACTLSVPVSEYAFYNNKSLTSLTLNSGCTSIGSSAFYQCSNIAGTLTIPSTTTAINSSAFRECIALTGLDMFNANALETIASSAFWADSALVGDLYFPETVTSVGSGAFRYAKGITAIYAMPTTVPTGANQYTFGEFDTSIPFYVTSPTAASNYAAAQYWQDFTNVLIGGFCGAEGNERNVRWLYNPTTHALTISGSGAMKDFASSTAMPWNSFKASITSIKICNGVTHVGNYAFYDCSSATEVWTSTTVTSFGNSAFQYCSSLNNVKYGNTSSKIYSYATDWAQIDFGNEYANPVYYAHTLQIYKPTGTEPAFGTVTTLENRSITQIKKYAFYNCTSITTLNNLSSNLSEMGYQAFCGCTALTSVTIPQNVTKVGDGLFQGCSSLTTVVWNAANCTRCLSASSEYDLSSSWNPFYSTSAPPRTTITSFTFGENVEVIPNGLCYNMTNLAAVSIPSLVTSIGDQAFQNCTSLAGLNLTAAASLSTIGAYAFDGCTAIDGVLYFPAGMTSIGNYAFQNCSAVDEITIAKTSGYITAATNSFTGMASTIPVHVNSADLKSYYQTATGWKYFSNFQIGLIIGGVCGTNLYWSLNVGTGELSYSGEGVRMYDWNNTDYLSPWKPFMALIDSVTIPSELQHIGEYAFYGCTSITKVNFVGGSSTNNSSIGDYAFYGCNGISGSFGIRAGVVTIGKHAFEGCSGITAFDFFVFTSGDYTDKRQLTTIDNYAFNGCSSASFSSLWTEATQYLTTIGEQAFANSHLYLSTSTAIPATLDTIKNKAFLNCTRVYGVTIPENVRVCGDEVFTGCSHLTHVAWNAINCAKYDATSTYNSGHNPFYSTGVSHNITNFTFGENVEVIPPYICKDMNSVTSIVVPSNVTSIGDAAFQNMTGLTSITADPLSPPTATQSSTFNGVDKTIPILMQPNAATEDYMAANGWKEFFDFYVWGYCGANPDKKNLKWILILSSSTPANVGKMTITGTGAMENYESGTGMPWNSYKTSSLTSLVIGNGVTTLGNRAFQSATSLTSITFPSTFSALGDYVFYGCSGLTSLTLPEGITNTGASMCYGCTSLAAVTLPSTLTTIGGNAFHSNAFTSITVPASVTSIGSYAFKNCTNLGSIIVPNITTLNEETFSGCSGLESVTLPNSLTSIKKNAFINCSTLVSITIPENVTEIVCVQGSGSATCPFSGCTSLTSVVWNARNCGGFSRVGQYQEYAMPFESIKTQITSFTFGSNVQSIPTYVCHGMTGFSSITIPASVTTIGGNAFNGCSNLATINSWAETPPTLGTNAWNGVSATANVYVLCPDVRTAYRETDWGTKFTDGNHWHLFYDLCGDDNELIIETDKTMTEAVLYGYKGNITVNPGVTFTMNDASSRRLEIHNLTLKPTARIDLLTGATYSVNNLIMERSGGSSTDNVATAQIKGSLTADNLILDFTLDDSRWFPISLPQAVAANAVTVDGVAQKPDNDYYALSFNGAKRAEDGYGKSGENWEWVTAGNLNANQGYLIGLPSSSKTLRFTMPGYAFNETTDKSVSVAENPSENYLDAGWNLIGNPFLQNYHNTTATMSVASDNLTAVVLLSAEGEHLNYSETEVSEAIIPPFSAVFIQSPATGSLVFDNSSARKNSPVRRQQTAETTFLQLTLAGNGASARTNFLINDDYDESYRIGADLVKWFNDNYQSQAAPTLYSFKSGDRLAFNARSEEMMTDVPVGFYATTDGAYTFSLTNDAEQFEHVLLCDHELNRSIDLKTSDYVFQTAAGTVDTRFTISATLAKQPEIVTDINTINDKQNSTKKIIKDGHLYILHGEDVYTSTGQKVL